MNYKKLSGLCIISSILMLVFTGILFRFIKVNFKLFMFIHRIFFVLAYIGAYCHGAYEVFYYGVFFSWFDKLFTILIIKLLSRKLKKPRF